MLRPTLKMRTPATVITVASSADCATLLPRSPRAPMKTEAKVAGTRPPWPPSTTNETTPPRTQSQPRHSVGFDLASPKSFGPAVTSDGDARQAEQDAEHHRDVAGAHVGEVTHPVLNAFGDDADAEQDEKDAADAVLVEAAKGFHGRSRDGGLWARR